MKLLRLLTYGVSFKSRSRIIFFIFFLSVLLFPFPAQIQSAPSNNTIDSLLVLYKSNPKDTVWIKVCQNLASQYLFKDPDSGIYYTEKAIEFATEENYPFHISTLRKTLGACYIVKAEYVTADKHLLYGLKGLQNLYYNDTVSYKVVKALSEIHTNMGLNYYYQGVYEKSIESFINAIFYSEKNGNMDRLAICISNIGNIYLELETFDKALEYYKKSIFIALKNDDLVALSQSYNNLGYAYLSLEKLDSANYYLHKSKTIAEKQNFENALPKLYINLSNVFIQEEIYDSALYYAQLSYNVASNLKYVEQKIAAKYNLAFIYRVLKKYKISESYYLELIKETENQGIRYKNKIQLELSNLYEDMGNYKKAFGYSVLSYASRDSIYQEESNKQIAEMEAKYQSVKKEEEIKLLQETAKLNKATATTNRIVFSAIIIILVLVIVLVVIAYRSYKHKQLIERQKIRQNAERKVLDTVIETEYKERKRFAEDLHDGLGVLLSTTRLYINEIEDSNKEERKQLIQQSNAMLDDAIANARNISNNIMPAALKNNGLEVAIKSFCDKINASGNIKIDVQSISFKKHYKNTIEITIYRILTEMINNTLKHAEATSISISLAQKANKLFITYKDNGKGFDYESMLNSTKKGMGLDNTISRINSIGGHCTIKSSAGNGFFAGIELSV